MKKIICNNVSLSVYKIKHKNNMSNFLNKYVAIKRYNSYSRKIKEIWNHSARENCHQKRDMGTEP